MPSHPFKTNFTAGELSPKLTGQVDLAKYAHGAACLENFAVQVHGGAARRAGTTYIQDARESGAFQSDFVQTDAFDVATGDTVVRLVPFKFSTTQVYMLEFGNQYIRVFTDRAPLLSGSVQVEITSPYAGEDLRSLRFTQSADVLYIASQFYPPHKLSRITATTFSLTAITFLPPPTTEVGVDLDASLTLTATTGLGITISASNLVFLAADVTRQIKADAGGRAVITGFTDAQTVTADVLDPFTTVGPIVPGDWLLEGSPGATATPSIKEPKFGAVTVTLGAAGFRSSEVGRYLRISGGVIKLTAITGSTTATGQILKVLTTVTAAPAGAWSLEEEAWSEARGYPGTVALYGQRLYWAGTLVQPDTIWGSVVADYENHGGGADDDDAVEFVVAQDAVNVIRWLKGLRQLMIGSVGGELQATGSTDGPITPSAVNVKNQTAWGSDYNVDAFPVANVILFLQRGARKIREEAFSFEADSFVSPDLSILAEHLFTSAIVEMAYLSQPDSILLCVRDDGVLLGMTYERPENVVAWHHHTTDGKFISVATLPNSSGDELWAVVEREFATSEGAFQTNAFQANAFQDSGLSTERRRSIEVFDGALTTDMSATYEGDPTTLIAVPHLESKTVAAVFADGTFQMDAWQQDLIQGDLLDFEYGVVVDGQLTMSAEHASVEIGIPFASHLELLRPELALATGSIQGRRLRYNEVTVRFLCTEGSPTINGEAIRYPDEGQGIGPFTGDVRVLEQGWDRAGIIRIEQPDPLPCTVLAVGGSIEADNG